MMKMNKDVKISGAIKRLKPYEAGEVFKIPSLPYSTLNAFGTMTKTDEKVTNIKWEACRDRFQGDSNGADYFEFLFCTNDIDKTIDFVRTCEEVLKLEDDKRLIFRKTNAKNILYVKMSPWWKYKLRRSLLTALLRCGRAYKTHTADDFKKAINSQYYLNSTKPAVDQFFFKRRTGSKLKGKSYFTGWQNTFVGKKEEDVRKVLTRIIPLVPAEQLVGPPAPTPEERAASETKGE